MDAYAPIGPAIVTTDEIGDPHTLGIRCFLNGVTVQVCVRVLIMCCGYMCALCCRV